MDVLEEKLSELFVDNVVREQGEYVTPLNAGELSDVLLARARTERETERAIVDNLRAVQDRVSESGGLTEEIYSHHAYAINTAARDATQQRWWGSGLTMLCEREDREPKFAEPEQLSRFPEDGVYGELAHDDHVNVFDTDAKLSPFEGTLFHLAYDSEGHLETMRLFHQGRRNGLKITSISGQELLDEIASRIQEYDGLPELSPVSLPLDSEAYRRKMEEFNDEYGDVITVRTVLSDQEELLVAQLSANPQGVAEIFTANAHKRGIDGYSNRGVMTYSIGDRNTHAFMDLFIEEQLTNRFARTEFDPELHRESPTLILPYLNPEFSMPVMTLYAEAKTAPHLQHETDISIGK